MKYWLIVYLSCCLLCCKRVHQTENSLVLHVDLNAIPSLINDVFDRVEIIPLEATENSLVVYPYEIKECQENLCIFDIHTQNLLMFDRNGRFKKRIAGKGQGPGEYTYLASIAVDEQNKQLQLLEPWGVVLNYTFEGKFIEKKVLPSFVPNYQSIYCLDDCFVTWTIPFDSKSNCISLINTHTMNIENSFCNGVRIVKLFSDDLYMYDNKVYYAQTIENHNVYEVTKDSLVLAYKWDFGKDNYDMYDWNFTYSDDNESVENNRFRDAVTKGTIPYWISYQQQNLNYYFANLTFGETFGKSVLYKKSDGTSYVFDGIEGGFWLENPRLMTDEYIICILFNKDFDKYRVYLSDSERKKLDTLTEDDNPCLLKLYFKK